MSQQISIGSWPAVTRSVKSRARDAFRAAILQTVRAQPFAGVADTRLRNARCVSFDVFDTLVTRPLADPSDAFLLCGMLLREQKLTTLNPADWRRLREEAEAALLRARHPDEVSLEEIYAHPLLDGALVPGAARDALLLELRLDQELSRPVAMTLHVAQALARSGATLLAISDTYLPQEHVVALLGAAGLHLPSDAVFTSSSSRMTKRSGRLFATVLARTRAAVELHVGDNLHSDFRQARRAGLRTAPFLASRVTRYERHFLNALQTPDLFGSSVAGAARAARLSRSLPGKHEQAIWDTSCNVTGPLLLSYVAWILREARRLDLRTVYFFARDGEILVQVANALQAGHANPIDCRYLHVSRRSLHFPAVTRIGEAERFWIFDNVAHRGLAHLLGRLDLTPAEYLALLPEGTPLGRVDPDAPLAPDEVALIEKSLEHPPVRDAILSRAARRRESALAYLRQQGLLEPGRVGVVDIGWRARLQRSICRIAETVEPSYASRLHGFYIDLDRPPADAGALGQFSGVAQGDFSWSARGTIFEVFCAAGHGTTLGYETDEQGRARPVLPAERNHAALSWGLVLQQEGVLEFSRELVEGLTRARIELAPRIEMLAGAASAVVSTFLSNPSVGEAAAFGSFEHASDEHHQGCEPLAPPIDLRPNALLSRLGPAYRGRRISYWPEASVVRSVPPLLRTPALALLRLFRPRRA